jgi:uncharacterized membrane protein
MRRRLLCEQRGAISILAALSLLFVIASAAMTVDIGQATWMKRDLQKTLDLVSLDAVRAVGDRQAAGDCEALATQFARESAENNGFDYDSAALGNNMEVTLGVADAKTKFFTPFAEGAVDCATANAVMIEGWTRSDNRFMPGNIGLDTLAIAMMDGKATFSLGSKTVAFDATTTPIHNAVLGQMLGGTVSLSAVGYNGLAAATVEMDDVWTNLGLGTTSQILNSEVTFGQLLDATIDALNDQGDPSSVYAASVLGTLKAQIDQSTHFKFGDLLEAASGDPGDAANAKVDVLNLIGAAATVANGTNLLNLTVPITIPGVTTTTMKLGVIEAPKWCWRCRVGHPTVQTGQVRMNLDMTLTQKLTLGLLLPQGTVHLPVYLEAGGATGDLQKIDCNEPFEDSTITVRTATQPVTAKIGYATDSTLNDPTVSADVRAGNIVSVAGLVNVTGTATSIMPGGLTDLLIELYQTLTAGSSGVSVSAGLLSDLQLTVSILGGALNATVVGNNTLAILTPVLTTLDSTLLTPVKNAIGSLGLSLGAADVTNHWQECTGRRLIG